MVWRSRVIFTRSSRAASSAGDGARTCTAAAGWLTGVGAEAAFSIAASMSPLVTRPSLPEPGTVAPWTPLSADSLRTDGASGASAGAAFGGAAAAGAAAAGGGAAGGAALAGGGPGLGGAPRRAVINLSEQRADGDGFTVLGGYLAEHARRRLRDFDGDLVGLELDQPLLDRHGIAGLLEPAADGGLGHGLAERRNANFSHRLVSPCVMAGRSSLRFRRLW